MTFPWELSRVLRDSADSFDVAVKSNSLPVYGTLKGQTKSTLGPGKTEFHFFEIFLLLELVWIYDKLNTNAKKSPCHRHTEKRRNTKLKLCMSEKLSTYNKKKIVNWSKKVGEEVLPWNYQFFRTLLTFPSPLFPIIHPGGEVSFRKRGSKFSLTLSHHHQTLHVTLREVKFTKGGAHSPSNIPLPLPLHTHTHTRMLQTPGTPLSGSEVYRKGYICYHPANDSRSGGKFPKRLWRCVGGGYNKMIWFC